MTPLGDRVLVKPDPKGDVKKGSLFIPEMAQSKPQEGTVVAVGAKVEHLKVGDRVLFGKYAGSEVRIDDDPYLIIREPDVMVRL